MIHSQRRFLAIETQRRTVRRQALYRAQDAAAEAAKKLCAAQEAVHALEAAEFRARLREPLPNTYNGQIHDKVEEPAFYVGFPQDPQGGDRRPVKMEETDIEEALQANAGAPMPLKCDVNHIKDIVHATMESIRLQEIYKRETNQATADGALSDNIRKLVREEVARILADEAA